MKVETKAERAAELGAEVRKASDELEFFRALDHVLGVWAVRRLPAGMGLVNADVGSAMAKLREEHMPVPSWGDVCSLAKELLESRRATVSLGMESLRSVVGNTGNQLGALGNLADHMQERGLLKHVQLYNVVALNNWKETIAQLYRKATDGDERALFRLVQVDKTVLSTPEVQREIRARQGAGDWDWFRGLGRAIARKPVNDKDDLLFGVLVVAALWDEWKDRATYREMVKALKAEGALPREATRENFRKKLNSMGLKKYRPERRQEKTG